MADIMTSKYNELKNYEGQMICYNNLEPFLFIITVLYFMI